MSGHSKWAKIKRQKMSSDVKKGNLYTKLAHNIIVAVKEGGGGDESSNFMLRMAIAKAKEANMPKENIEKAIKKALGIGQNGALENVSYDAIGKNGVVLIIDCLTDNKNRTVSSVKNIIQEHGFVFGGGNSFWQFEEKGYFEIEPVVLKESEKFKTGKEIEEIEINKEDLILELMDIEGVEDVTQNKGEIIITTEKDSFSKVYKHLSEKKIKVLKAEIMKRPKIKVEVSEAEKEKVNKLIAILEENEDIESIWKNI